MFLESIISCILPLLKDILLHDSLIFQHIPLYYKGTNNLFFQQIQICFHSVTNLHTILRYSCFQSIQHCLFFFLFLFISNTIQWKTQFNLNKVCFFIHAKSSLYNRLLDIAKTAFQKQLTSKSTVF